MEKDILLRGMLESIYTLQDLRREIDLLYGEFDRVEQRLENIADEYQESVSHLTELFQNLRGELNQ